MKELSLKKKKKKRSGNLNLSGSHLSGVINFLIGVHFAIILNLCEMGRFVLIGCVCDANQLFLRQMWQSKDSQISTTFTFQTIPSIITAMPPSAYLVWLWSNPFFYRFCWQGRFTPTNWPHRAHAVRIWGPIGRFSIIWVPISHHWVYEGSSDLKKVSSL